MSGAKLYQYNEVACSGTSYLSTKARNKSLQNDGL